MAMHYSDEPMFSFGIIGASRVNMSMWRVTLRADNVVGSVVRYVSAIQPKGRN